MKYFRYLRSLLRHKWFVFIAGMRVGVPIWRLIIHDWSKFVPAEFFPYAESFYGDRKRAKAAFDLGWLHHQKHNPHHWQYWILIQDFDDPVALDMPLVYVKEMIADWMGASKAYTGSWEMHDWLIKSFPKVASYMSPETVNRVEVVLKQHDYDFLWTILEAETAIRPSERLARLT